MCPERPSRLNADALPDLLCGGYGGWSIPTAGSSAAADVTVDPILAKIAW